MTDRPLVQFRWETPSGHLVSPAGAISLGATVTAGTNMLYYRFGLPLLGAVNQRTPACDKSCLALKVRTWARSRLPVPEPGIHRLLQRQRCRRIPKYAWRPTWPQTGFEPGAILTLRAALTEFGIPLGGAGVQAELRIPDATQSVISLADVEPGVFATAVVASLAGVYTLANSF
jgi:hypothetical protein